jgi:hypothetical protein
MPLPSYITHPPDLTKKGKNTVAENSLPQNLDELITQAVDALDGVTQLEASLGIKQNTALVMEPDVVALQQASVAFSSAQLALSNARAARRSANSNGRGFASIGRDLLKPTLGAKPSPAWAEAGWNDRSLAIPNDDEQLLPLLNTLKGYLTAHPALEQPAAPFNFTAVRAGQLYDALQAARATEHTKQTECEAALNTRNLCEEAVRRRLRGLLSELAQLLDPLSPHWLTFGFYQPGAPNVPDPVKGLAVTAKGNGQVFLSWDPPARADYFQIWLKTAAPGAEFELLASTPDTDRMLDGQPVGAVMQLKVRAVNETGEGKFSAVVTVTVT